MGLRGLSLVALLVLAGCLGGVQSGLGDGSTPTVDPDNPWEERTLEVAVRDNSGTDRAYEPLVRRALDYWERNADRYVDYPVRFAIVDSADEADVVVSFVAEVAGCDDVREAAGCAPLVTDDARIVRPERMAVLAGLDDASTVLVLKHEFGHVLGLSHDDEPSAVMQPRADLEYLPLPNATARALPWKDGTISVFVNLSGVSTDDRATIRRQVRHAVTYYDDGAAGHVPENVTLELTDDRTAADVVVTFPDSAPCGSGDGSCGTRYGVDPDDDGAPEWYTRAEIAIAGVDPEAVGWHVGYWLGYALGFDDPADWPAVFRNATAEQRRSDWWADATDRRRVAAPVG